METAETVILDALKEIVAIPAEASVDAYKAQAGIFYLNLMMFELSSVGVNLGYTTVNSSLDTLRQISYDSPANSPFSSNLPVGSGNERWNTARFFNEQETPILTENYGNIAPESA